MGNERAVIGWSRKISWRRESKSVNGKNSTGGLDVETIVSEQGRRRTPEKARTGSSQ